VKAGNTTGEKINDFLKTEDFKGASKQIKFKDNGEPQTNAIYVYQVVGGVIKNLGASTEAKITGRRSSRNT
jgi:branched-chain amino acid transport system substrate-binding protein